MKKKNMHPKKFLFKWVCQVDIDMGEGGFFAAGDDFDPFCKTCTQLVRLKLEKRGKIKLVAVIRK